MANKSSKPVRSKKPAGTKAVRKAAKKPVAKAVSTVASGLTIPVLGVAGKPKLTASLPKELFGAKVNIPLLTQAVRVYLSNQRHGTASTKTRGEVEGSTRKIYRQKGTGRARHGAIRAPIFVGGGIVFGPRPRDFSLSMPQSMKRVALVSALTQARLDGKVRIVDGLESLEPKTKRMAQALGTLDVKSPILLVVGPKSNSIVRSARNIDSVDILPATSINAYSILSHASILFTKSALDQLTQTFIQTS